MHLIMTQLRYWLFSALITFGISASSSVLDLGPANFENVVLQSNKPAFVEFYAPWCGHCQKLAPIWEQLADKFAFAEGIVSIAKVDADEHKDLGRRFGVQGFPTLKWFDGKSNVPEDYKGGRDLESLSAFIIEKTGIKVKAKKIPSSFVEVLNDQTFKKTVGGGKNVLVAFTASWCGHCKTLEPIWERLASDFATEPDVLIAKVDATAENAKFTAESQDIKSYPTIKYFSKGSSVPIDYNGERTEQAFIEYLNEEAGTHRAVGGGLNAKAGTIGLLDTMVDDFVAGGNSATVFDEASKAARVAKGKYADYYVKVFEKVSKSQGYAAKELARLEGLIKNGGLAPEKADDLVSRSNILRKFSETKEKAKQEL